ncbi:hypothetical protein M0805_003180 [Coniferiporia weirii]|nr:hypothetical protein M0805_003180 [Coniferiporia weirii]
MMFKSLFALATFVASASLSAAAPTGPVIDIVYNPMITYPVAGTVWNAGEVHTVTWDTSAIPAGQNNATGTILLGHIENNSENLNIAQPLATGFKIMSGATNITVPLVTDGDDYIVVLFGDSGNASKEFTISNGLPVVSTPSVSTAVPSATSEVPTPSVSAPAEPSATSEVPTSSAFLA